MSKVYQCDRCKIIFDPRVLQNGEPYIARKGKADIDLCPTCYKKLMNFLNNEDLPICKECRFCKHCMRNKKLSKITYGKGYPFIYYSRHNDHFSPYDTCEFFDEEADNER